MLGKKRQGAFMVALKLELRKGNNPSRLIINKTARNAIKMAQIKRKKVKKKKP
jgi:hypothetical protein